MDNGRNGRLAVLALLSSLAGHAGAQVQPPAAPVTPGTVGDTLRQPPPLRPPQSSPVESPQRPSVAQQAGGARTTVSRFEIEGNTIYSDAQLAALLADYVGKPLTLLEIYDAADRIADHYVRNGYTLASVGVPPQRVESGVVHLEVVEGRIADIRYEGVKRYRPEHLGWYLGEVRSGEVYRGGALEGGLRDLNELPGLSARAVLKPGERYGTSDIVIRASETTFAGNVFVDNYGRESIGEYRMAATLDIYNPLRSEDSLRVLALHAEGGLLDYGYVEYGLPLDFDGARLSVSYGEAQFESRGNTFVSGRNGVARVGAEVPLIRTRDLRLTGTLAARHVRAESNLESNGRILFDDITRTEITLLDVGASWSAVTKDLTVLQLTGNIATDFQKHYRRDRVGEHQRFRLELDAQALYPLVGQLYGYVRVNGVWSPDPLVDTEAFSIGGPTSVRAYPAGEVRGDSGIQSTLGLQHPFRWGPVAIMARTFLDGGRVWVAEAPPGFTEDGPVGARDTDALMSMGVGADFELPANLRFKFDAAVPVMEDRRPVSDGKHGRVFGSLSWTW